MSSGLIMHALHVQPGQPPVDRILVGTEAEMEDLVDGKIASIGIDDGVCVIYNAFSDKLNLPLNRTIDNQPFYGSFVVVSYNEFGDLISLSEDNLEYYTNLLALD
jgi:hypothetical protein